MEEKEAKSKIVKGCPAGMSPTANDHMFAADTLEKKGNVR